MSIINCCSRNDLYEDKITIISIQTDIDKKAKVVALLIIATLSLAFTAASDEEAVALLFFGVASVGMVVMASSSEVGLKTPRVGMILPERKYCTKGPNGEKWCYTMPEVRLRDRQFLVLDRDNHARVGRSKVVKDEKKDELDENRHASVGPGKK